MTFLQAVAAGPKTLRMYKGPGNLNGLGNSHNIVKDMAVDADTDPAAFLNDALVVSYDAEPYSANLYGQITWNSGNTPRVECRIVRNGSALVTGTRVTTRDVPATASTTITVQPGDSFELWWLGEGSFFQRPVLLAGQNTFLRIEPV
ncbi:hypothetical protein SEA_OHMYWARD_10 [Gordonia phage OhMyWard]|uniref:Uncharacterized protein n=1 Tax=Gordonia phage OhMyWard TaxID=2652414 RepID=A0A5P8D8X6_9CAUD|nr:hypothetical protein HWC72_gp10 [Gordonia phage OhMyWard]QFP94892.1 hypothetical protein SEA_OHMYWARD_10 [Gordonia phage OhMyWard]